MSTISDALRFDVTALDRASATFAKVADAVEEVGDELDKLDRKRASPEIDVETKKAEQRIDRFAKNLRKKVAAAVKNLPELEIDADSSDAEREIAQVRKDLQTLSDVEINTDVDAARAEAKLRELTARVTRLNADSVDIKVKADTLAAVRALSSIKLDAVPLDVDTRPATRQIGTFAADARRRIDSALSSLPELEITADSSDADREIADIRAELAALSNRTVGVDIDATEADARLRELKTRLDDLSASSADVRVQTDTAAAVAALKLVDTEVDALDGRTATVRVKTDRSVADTTVQFAQLGRAMKTIAIPAALVTAAPPILALGQAAVTASGSLWLMPAALSAAGLAFATLKTGFSGFGDAISSDATKSAEAMAKLAPAAREAATAVRGLAPAWDALRLDVQGQLFDGLGKKIASLGGTYMPILRAAMADVAQGFNYGAHQIAAFLAQASTVSTVKTMFDDLGNAVENLTAGTMAPLTAAFINIGAVGAKVLNDISSGAGAAAERFAAFIAQARGTGQLEAWMRGGVNALKQLGQIVVNVGASLGSMMRAAGIASGDFLGSLVNLTGRMREFLASAQGQQAMITIFEGINRVVTALIPGIAAVGRALGQMAQNQATTGALEAIATALSRLVEAAAPVIVAFTGVTASAIRPLAAALGGLAPIIGPVIAALVSLKLAASAVKFVGMITGLSTLASATTGVVGRLAAVRAALAGTSAVAATSGAGMAAAGAATAGAGAKAAASAGKLRTAAAALTGLSVGAVGVAAPLVAGGAALYGIGVAANSGKVGLDEMNAAVEAGGPAMEAMRQKAAEQSAVVGDGLVPVLDRAAASFDDLVNSNIFGVATTGEFNKAAEEQRQKIEAAAAAAGVSVGTYQLMNGALERSTGAARQVTDNLARIGPAMSGIKAGVAPTKEMQAALDSTGNSARTAAQEAGLSAQALGGVGAGANQAAASMQASRDAFIQTATSAGMTGAEANKLADSLGLIPAKARTDFETNAATTALEVQQVSDKLREVPVGKSVTVNAMTEPAKAALSGLGVTVKTLPDGRVEVTANTAAAQANMQAFINGTRDQRADITINGQTAPAHTALQSVLAQVAAGRGTINIDGQDQPARGVLAHLLGMVQGTNATINIGGNQVPAEQAVNAVIAAIDSKSGVVDINGNRIPIDQVLASLSGNIGMPVVKDIHGNAVPLMNAHGTAVGAITQPATKPLVGDPAGILGANSTATGAVQTPAFKPIEGVAGGALAANAGVNSAVQTPATKPIGGNPSGGLGAVDLLQGAAQAPATKPVGANTGAGQGAVAGLQGQAQAGATKPVGANTGAGQGAVAGLQGQAEAGATKPVNAETGGAMGAINSLISAATRTVTMVVNVVKNWIGHDGGIVANAEGNIVPMANGGQTRPEHHQGHRLRGMSGVAHKVPPNTWRITGDRATGAEAYIPITKSVRSQAILSETARRMGYDLVKKGYAQAEMELPQPTITVNRPAPILDVGPRVTTGPTAPTASSPDRVRVQAMVDQFGAALRNTVAVARAGQPVDLRPLLSEVATLRGALAESLRGDVNIQNQFAVAEMGQAAGEVARVQRTLSHLGLFS